jgi:hypothetical protein
MKTVQLSEGNFAIVKDNGSWMSGKELMFIRDVMGNNHKFVTTQWNNHISPISSPILKTF